jgi:hypothetical protein
MPSEVRGSCCSQVRFKHDPSSPDAYCGAALSSNVIHITRVAPPADGTDGPGEWAAKVGGWECHRRVLMRSQPHVDSCWVPVLLLLCEDTVPKPPAMCLSLSCLFLQAVFKQEWTTVEGWILPQVRATAARPGPVMQAQVAIWAHTQGRRDIISYQGW